MIIATIVVLGAALMFVVLRFVQPKLIYWLRYLVVKAKINKAFIDAERGERVKSFPNLLVRDLRPEGVPEDIPGILWRARKIRELYGVLDPKRKNVDVEDLQGKTNICIAELSSFIGALGKSVVPLAEIDSRSVRADEVLKFVLVSRSGDQPSLFPPSSLRVQDQAIKEELMSKPIAIEDVVEILIACIHALAYRREWEQEREAQD